MAGGEGFQMELRQEMRVTTTKGTGEQSARDSRAVAISGPVTQSSGASDWLVEITKESNAKLTAIQDRQKPRIQRVPKLLREAERNQPSFKPEVVSLGPYHHGREDLAAMEENKKAAAARFADGRAAPMHVLYDNVREVVGEARKCYADEFLDKFNDVEFANMMFFDGCFILHFIDCYLKKGDLKKGETKPTTSPHLQGFICRDIFLLENQVPFKVLKALMSLRSVDCRRFIRTIMGNTTSTKDQEEKQVQSKDVPCEVPVDEGPIHLLDLLRTSLLEKEQPEKPPSSTGANWQCFRSVMELKEAGIKFSKSETSRLGDVKFLQGRVHGHLQLPQIVVDDLTRARFLNLIALEMCPDSTSGYGVTSYICFLDQLIDHADDVKELRRKEILLNALGSDQQVADFFNEVATGLSPDSSAYSQAAMGITVHYKNKRKVSIVKMIHTHFSSPWTTISFIAAVFLIILTFLQTFFAVFSKFAVSH